MIFNIFTGGGNGGWGYANLNFSIYRYGLEDTLPDTAEENTIVVFTDVEISSYIFDSVMPENPEEGMVWFITDNMTGIVSFNILKENTIKVYPIRAMQYIEGEWVYVFTKSYQNGWVDWFNGYLYNNGSVNEDVTGGWTGDKGETLYGEYWYAPSTLGGVCETQNVINLTNYNVIKANCTSIDGVSVLYVHKDDERPAIISFENTGVVELDISAVSGEYYVSLAKSGASGGNYTVDKVWLE